jgi:hypothetical protein
MNSNHDTWYCYYIVNGTIIIKPVPESAIPYIFKNSSIFSDLPPLTQLYKIEKLGVV